jgi:hypothetical protein
MIPVARVPSSGCPEESSKIEPTEAIAATQDAPRKREVLGDMNMRNATPPMMIMTVKFYGGVTTPNNSLANENLSIKKRLTPKS